MKIVVRAFLVTCAISAFAGAECSYFRTAATLLSCAPADARIVRANDVYRDPTEIPELADPRAQALMQISCRCEYSLKGADPLCDIDQSLERTAALGVENAAQPCRDGPRLCRDLCPSRLP